MRTIEEFNELAAISDEDRLALGMMRWDEESQLWLFPASWYDQIPDGLEITIINGQRRKFKRGVTDRDQRVGMLAFGIVAKKVAR